MRILSLAVCLCFTTLGLGLPDDGFKSIFNGKNLDGWDGNPKLWSVEDGAITGKTGNEPHNKLKHNTFLVWKGGEVSNFNFRCKFKIDGGNSGIQYRSKEFPKGEFGPIVGGYQADFEAGKTYSGILYDERGVAGGRGVMCQRGEKVRWTSDNKKEITGKTKLTSEQIQESIKKDGWNTYEIIADGVKLIHKVNGNVSAEILDESPKALTKGILALQIHVGPVMTVQFKDLELKTLGAQATPPEKKKVN
ncbi:MAG: DUF1080 domain-containing protein [Gemmataceae bacterium]|nr:DUF1080 domain-containing protein [Gemmataceae bacterium]